MLTVGLVFPSESIFASAPRVLEQLKTVRFELESQSYDFFFELLSHVTINVAVICIDGESNKPFELMSLIRTTYPGTKIIGVVSHAMPALEEAALQSGARKVLCLPLSTEVIDQCLADMGC